MASSRAGKRRDPDEIARLVQAGLAAGLDAVDSVRAAKAGKATGREARELDRRHRRAVEQHEKALRKHRARLARDRGRVTTFTAAAGVTGTLGVLDLVTTAAVGTDAVPGPTWMWLAACAGSVVVAVRARLRLHDMSEPLVVPPPPPAPPVLPPGTRGSAESARLMRARVQLAGLVPTVTGLHPGAGDELRRADAEAAPGLDALVSRLAVLGRIERDMNGTSAATAAATAAQDVQMRLATGVDTYEQLIAASAALLAAPDMGRSSEAVLGPAIDAMAAYTEGLAVSAQTFRP